MHTHARACMACAPDAPGHVDARAAPWTPALDPCVPSSMTTPATTRTPPRARGNAVADELVDDVRHGLSPNCELDAAASTRSPPEEEATPGDETASRRFLIHHNVAAHHSATRRSSDVLSDPLPAPPMEPYVQTETYDLENGGSLVFERDLYLVSERLERPPPKFHGVRIHDTPTGEQQWMITADLKGSSEPPISERILFSFKACNWPDGLAHALQEGLARVCGQNIAALRGSRFAYFARHDTMGEPMALSSHPVLKIHVQHLDFMLHETRKELELTRVHNHRAQMTLAHHAEAIRMLAKDRKSLRLQRAKKDATIRRLREKIRTLEVTVRTQQDQIQEMEDEGDDIQGGDDFLSDDNDFEDDEFTDEEDYAFLESEEDGIIPIDVDENEE
ncbi:hypothetical protein QYE76_006746 [Lolium multiflorum]|uniref:Uncharacterized protein n=1 Tax=Lolium multiflorum TaxID=4521 RepID=A0AAD8QRZ4_LOLMU|nr:hypothetical protein QYE76_031593 [Lolium multiflorum]KAK1632431.1 hypothetical protein QYE76_006746 [Lolium multiflorum]